MRREKGITLIALVITIIVLLILAGVAIAMLSGENGILRKAAEAKTRTNEGQKQEMSSLLSYEMALNTNNEYKIQDEYITGFEYDETSNRTVKTVSQVESGLPEGYKIVSRYEYDMKTNTGKDIVMKDEEKDTTYISTGMAVQKDGQEVARTILFGDVNCDGIISSKDVAKLAQYACFYKFELKDYQKIAGNIENNKEINYNDRIMISKYIAGSYGIEINQMQSITTTGKNLKRMYTELQEYISLLNEETGYTFEYNEEEDTYKLKGVKKDITVETLINQLPNPDKVSIVDKDDNEISSSDKVIDGYYVEIKFEYEGGGTLTPKFAYIEVEK